MSPVYLVEPTPDTESASTSVVEQAVTPPLPETPHEIVQIPAAEPWDSMTDPHSDAIWTWNDANMFEEIGQVVTVVFCAVVLFSLFGLLVRAIWNRVDKRVHAKKITRENELAVYLGEDAGAMFTTASDAQLRRFEGSILDHDDFAESVLPQVRAPQGWAEFVVETMELPSLTLMFGQFKPLSLQEFSELVAEFGSNPKSVLTPDLKQLYLMLQTSECDTPLYDQLRRDVETELRGRAMIARR